MAFAFPLYVDLEGNNCVIVGGGHTAYTHVQALLRFKAKVTVISPTLCSELHALDQTGVIRYLPRRYYRGDCTNSMLCIAATNVDAINIAVSDECKAKGIPVSVTHPAAFGTFAFPTVLLHEEVSVAIGGSLPHRTLEALCEQLQDQLPAMLEEAKGR